MNDTASLSDLRKIMPSISLNHEYVALVEALDSATTIGRELRAVLLRSAPAFVREREAHASR